VPLRHNQLENASARPINCPPLSSAGLPGPVELGYPFATLLSWNEIMWSLPLPAPLDHTLFLGGWETMSSEEYQLEKCMDGSDSLQVTPRCRTVCMWDCPSSRPSGCAPHCRSFHQILTESRVRSSPSSGVVTRYAPTWEPFQAGSFVMDLTGTTRLFGIACIMLNIPPIESPANLHECRE